MPDMKKYTLAILIGILIALVLQSHYNVRCMELGFDDAAVTIHGAYCHTHKQELRFQYMLLSELEQRELENQRRPDPRMPQFFPTELG